MHIVNDLMIVIWTHFPILPRFGLFGGCPAVDRTVNGAEIGELILDRFRIDLDGGKWEAVIRVVELKMWGFWSDCQEFPWIAGDWDLEVIERLTKEGRWKETDSVEAENSQV
jgi:hypothetical protein